MINSTDIESLTAKLEGATKPSKALDKSIAKAFGTFEIRREFCGGMEADEWEFYPNYTASLDAAMRLVPEGCEAYVTRIRSGRGKAFVGPNGCQNEFLIPIHATPALALCIAALKARLAQEAA